jgi:hypothetical protein
VVRGEAPDGGVAVRVDDGVTEAADDGVAVAVGVAAGVPDPPVARAAQTAPADRPRS